MSSNQTTRASTVSGAPPSSSTVRPPLRNGINVGAIAGAVSGVSILLALVAISIFFCIRRRKSKRLTHRRSYEDEHERRSGGKSDSQAYSGKQVAYPSASQSVPTIGDLLRPFPDPDTGLFQQPLPSSTPQQRLAKQTQPAELDAEGAKNLSGRPFQGWNPQTLLPRKYEINPVSKEPPHPASLTLSIDGPSPPAECRPGITATDGPAQNRSLCELNNATPISFDVTSIPSPLDSSLAVSDEVHSFHPPVSPVETRDTSQSITAQEEHPIAWNHDGETFEKEKCAEDAMNRTLPNSNPNPSSATSHADILLRGSLQSNDSSVDPTSDLEFRRSPDADVQPLTRGAAIPRHNKELTARSNFSEIQQDISLKSISNRSSPVLDVPTVDGSSLASLAATTVAKRGLSAGDAGGIAGAVVGGVGAVFGGASLVYARQQVKNENREYELRESDSSLGRRRRELERRIDSVERREELLDTKMESIRRERGEFEEKFLSLKRERHALESQREYWVRKQAMEEKAMAARELALKEKQSNQEALEGENEMRTNGLELRQSAEADLSSQLARLQLEKQELERLVEAQSTTSQGSVDAQEELQTAKKEMEMLHRVIVTAYQTEKEHTKQLNAAQKMFDEVRMEQEKARLRYEIENASLKGQAENLERKLRLHERNHTTTETGLAETRVTLFEKLQVESPETEMDGIYEEALQEALDQMHRLTAESDDLRKRFEALKTRKNNHVPQQLPDDFQGSPSGFEKPVVKPNNDDFAGNHDQSDGLTTECIHRTVRSDSPPEMIDEQNSKMSSNTGDGNFCQDNSELFEGSMHEDESLSVTPDRFYDRSADIQPKSEVNEQAANEMSEQSCSNTSGSLYDTQEFEASTSYGMVGPMDLVDSNQTSAVAGDLIGLPILDGKRTLETHPWMKKRASDRGAKKTTPTETLRKRARRKSV